MRKDGVNLQRNTRGQFAAKCGGQIARNIQMLSLAPGKPLGDQLVLTPQLLLVVPVHV